MWNRPSRARLAVHAANAAILAVAFALAGCGSSGSTVTSPTSFSRCPIAFDAPSSTVPASGGNGSITVKTDRVCQWTAQPEVGWLNIIAGSTGQGDGTVPFSAAANNDPVARSGGIMLNGQRA